MLGNCFRRDKSGAAIRMVNQPIARGKLRVRLLEYATDADDTSRRSAGRWESGLTWRCGAECLSARVD